MENIKRFCCKILSIFSAVTEFWKSVKIWESYCQKFGGFLFWNTV